MLDSRVLMQDFKTALLIVAAGMLLLSLLSYFGWQKETNTSVENDSLDQVTIKGVPIQISVADTPAEREQGLSGRPSLAENEGLLFLFDTPGEYGFWMKEMRFPIDILWFSEEGNVVHIEEQLQPDTYPTVFSPQAPSLYVLEVPAGFVERHQIKIGDQLEV